MSEAAEAPVSSTGSPAKYVQEMSRDGDEPPPRYIVKQIPNSSPPSAPVPVIDLSQLSSPEELGKLRSALSSWGCFQVHLFFLFFFVHHAVLFKKLIVPD